MHRQMVAVHIRTEHLVLVRDVGKLEVVKVPITLERGRGYLGAVSQRGNHVAQPRSVEIGNAARLRARQIRDGRAPCVA